MERKSFFKQRKNLTDREVVFLHPDIACVQLFQRPDLGPQGRRLQHPASEKVRLSACRFLTLRPPHWPALMQYMRKGDILPSDTPLATQVCACTRRMAERAQVRELQAARPAAVAANAGGYGTAQPLRKPLPPDTFHTLLIQYIF